MAKNTIGNISFGDISANSQLSDIQMYTDLNYIYLRGNPNLDNDLHIELLCFKVSHLNGTIDSYYNSYEIEKRNTKYILKYKDDGAKIVVKKNTTLLIGNIVEKDPEPEPEPEPELEYLEQLFIAVRYFGDDLSNITIVNVLANTPEPEPPEPEPEPEPEPPEPEPEPEPPEPEPEPEPPEPEPPEPEPEQEQEQEQPEPEPEPEQEPEPEPEMEGIGVLVTDIHNNNGRLAVVDRDDFNVKFDLSENTVNDYGNQYPLTLKHYRVSETFGTFVTLTNVVILRLLSNIRDGEYVIRIDPLIAGSSSDFISGDLFVPLNI